MNLTLGLVTLILSVLIAFSAAKGFWSAPLEMLQKEAGSAKVILEETEIMAATPTPTPTSTSTTSTSTSTSITPTTTTFGPCINGCIPSIGTSNGPMAPPTYNTNYNGRNPLISSYPTVQP